VVKLGVVMMSCLVAGALLASPPAATATVAATPTTPTTLSTTATAADRYCPRRDAYEVTPCDTRPALPANALGDQLAWLRDQLGGGAATVTPRDVRAHVSPAVLASPGTSAPELAAALRHTYKRFGRMSFEGFSYPPRTHQAMALFRTDDGLRSEVPVGVNSRTHRINSLAVTLANPVLVPRGRLSGWFDVGGRRIFLRCTGHGGPTVVFENGLTTDWFTLQNRLARHTRACSYDPARQNGPASRSDSAPAPRTGNDRVRDLHALLAAAQVPGPYVLVGHSNGGLFSLMYASRHPRQVAGLVLVDGVHPRYHRSLFRALRHLVPESEWPAAYAQLCAVPPLQLDWEQMDICRSEHQARAQLAAAPLHAMPLAVISHGRTEGPPSPETDIGERVWAELQRDLAAMLPDATHTIARRSGHDIAHTQPGLVLRQVFEVVAEVREDR
jgi:pimeloyl-ACP methyl ester carboxylesterase